MNDVETHADRRPVEAHAGDGHTAAHLAAKHRISVQQAHDLLAEVGPDPERLDVVAATVRIASGR